MKHHGTGQETHVAMENGPIIGDLPIKDGGFS